MHKSYTKLDIYGNLLMAWSGVISNSLVTLSPTISIQIMSYYCSMLQYLPHMRKIDCKKKYKVLKAFKSLNSSYHYIKVNVIWNLKSPRLEFSLWLEAFFSFAHGGFP